MGRPSRFHLTRTGQALTGAARDVDWLVLDVEALGHLEGLAASGGAALPGTADLVWCLPLSAATNLEAAHMLGRWVRVLGSRRVEFLLEDPMALDETVEITPLRRLAGLVAPGVAVGVTRAVAGRWPDACMGVARRLHGTSEVGSS